MKTKIAAAFMIIAATILAIYGQDIAYYLDEYLVETNPAIYLTMTTVISITLYILSWIIVYRMIMKRDRIPGLLSLLFTMGVVMSGVVSLLAVFIAAMWWG